MVSLAGGQVLEVDAGRKRPPRTGDRDQAHRIVGGDLLRDVEQFAAARHRHRVEALGPGQLQPADLAVLAIGKGGVVAGHRRLLRPAGLVESLVLRT
jgi:hypothetical protein